MKTISFLIVLSIAASTSTLAGNEIANDPSPPAVTVTGLAEIKVEPDQALLNCQILVDNKITSFEEALAEHDRQIKRAMKVLADNGIEKKQIVSNGSQYHRPFYYYWNRFYKDKKIAYQIPISVQIKDLNKIDKIYDDLSKVGAVVTRLDYSSSKLQELRREAFADAVKVARTKAEIMTAAVDQSIGQAVQITEEENYRRYWGGHVANTVRSSPNGSQPESSQFSGGEVTVSAKVTIVFELK